MVNQSLKNKKIIISAGASGIGLATAKVCLSRGATVYLCDIDSKSLAKLNKHPLKNKRLFSYLCDASNEYQVSVFFEKVKKKTKKIDALINNVGIAGPTGSLEKLKSKDWENTLHVDVNRAKVIKAKVVMKKTDEANDIDKSNLIKVNEDQFIEEFLPQIVCSNSNCEVVDKSGNVKGYISNRELQTSLTKS